MLRSIAVDRGSSQQLYTLRWCFSWVVYIRHWTHSMGFCSKAYEPDEAKYTICDEHGQPSAGQNAHGGLHHVGSSEAGADGSEAPEGHRGRCHNGRQPVVVGGNEGAREERHGTAECERHGGSQCGLGGVGEFIEVDAEFVPGVGLQCVHPR